MNYELLDSLILGRAASAGRSTSFFLMTGAIRDECERIADATGRDAYRILDGRLQALRKAGKIAYTSKAGWALV